MMTPSIAQSIAAVPSGHWAVGVSGGADSVALLLLLRDRPDLQLHVVHLDHETRVGASGEDARFVSDLATRLAIPSTIALRSDVERDTGPVHDLNVSARFRAARLALFQRVVDAHHLAGVILAHHADDQAETVLHRLLRGSGPSGLGGMSTRSRVARLTILRPLLGVPCDTLRAELSARGQAWREDASNASDVYLRNRLRRVLSQQPDLIDPLLTLSQSCRTLRDWTRAHTPVPGETLRAADLLKLPLPLQREFARRWLTAAGVPAARIDPGVVTRLLDMARDAATSPRQHFPGKVLVRRLKGMLSVQRAPA